MTRIEDTIVHEVEDEVKPKTLKGTLWNITKTLLKIVITAALLYYVFSKVPFSSVKIRFINANYWFMGAGVLFYFASMVVSSWRLLSFFKSIHLRVNCKFNFRLYMLGIFYNFLLPGGIGGDGYKIYLLNKKFKLPAKKAFWAIFFDRLSGLWAIGLIVIALKVFVPQIDIGITIPLVIFVVGTIAYYIVIRIFFKEFSVKQFFKGHLKAVLVQGLQVLTIIMVLLGQDFTGKFAPYLLAFLVSALAAVVPINIGGAGARELVFQKSAGFFHIDAGLGIYLSISFFLISLIVALTGIYYLLRPEKLELGMPKTEESSG
jgi:uncharacterized membrane protein YbhN (UPF0104 family)